MKLNGPSIEQADFPYGKTSDEMEEKKNTTQIFVLTFY
jgi:hypothetical protein